MTSAGDVERIEIDLFLEAIARRWGYDLRDYSRPSIERRVQAALAASGAANLGALQHEVLHDRDAFADVLDAITVRVTDLFRDPEVYLALRTKVVPLLRTYALPKIWHAGCASGEEAYSTAILIHEEGLDERTQIYGTDVSQRAIAQAKDGVYPARHVTTFTKNHRAAGATSDLGTWLTAAYDRIAMREALRKRLVFFQHDLVGDQVFGEMHVVFCRNVLIYFGQELRRRVLDKLAASLVPGGFLVLGTSEELPGSTCDERFKPFARAERIYRYEP
ncbi:MAG: protein-glutamate O-methyltransferase CheR [Labilithrix sp.]|nr:protein-glutamate O-methyltransferase CheR [Labilithrix sp.]MCW5816912.1 protein-glutamate O-methyltransferase CheR [Labilithrix sp.]